MDINETHIWNCPTCGREIVSEDAPDGSSCFECNERALESINNDLRRSRDSIDAVTNQEAVRGPCADPVIVLAAIQQARSRLDDAERWAAALLKLNGSSWTEVAEAAGMRSRQAAQQRFSDDVDSVGWVLSLRR